MKLSRSLATHMLTVRVVKFKAVKFNRLNQLKTQNILPLWSKSK